MSVSDGTAMTDGPTASPTARRNWTVLVLGLALASFLSAAITAVTQPDSSPVIGATALGFGFVALAVVSRTAVPGLFDALSAAWDEHRRATWAATGLFAFGVLIGIGLLLAGVNLLDLLAELLQEGLAPDSGPGNGQGQLELELTASFFIQNNSVPFLLAIGGALSLGLLTAFIMVANGIIVGNVGAAVGELVGVEFIVVGLVPHGIFELPALFIAAGVGFRLVTRFGERVLGSREAFLTRPYLARTAALVGFAWLLLVLAAVVEAYVTPALLEMLFAEQVQQPGPLPTTP